MELYNPKQVKMTVGSILLFGFRDDTMIEVDLTNDAFTKYVGGDGRVTRIQSADESGTVTVNLMQTSPCNNLLSAFYDFDRASGVGVSPLSIIDSFGTTLVTSQNCWIRKLPKLTFNGKDTAVRTWIFDCDVLRIIVGGGAVV